MSIANTFNFIWKHPLASRNKTLAFKRFLKWQFAQKIHPFPVVYPFVENSKLLVTKGMVGATGNIYAGLHEFNDMAFLLHFLHKQDLFIDIGANVGSYTVLASAVKEAYTIAVEPIPCTFAHLCNNVHLNKITDKVNLLNIGLGSKISQLAFTSSLDSTNHVANESDINSDTITVEVNTLDNIVNAKNPVLIKIDVEGFEQEVLNGAHYTLNNSSLQAIIIEINDNCEKYGFSAASTHQLLTDYHFKPYSYSPFDRTLFPVKQTFSIENTIYIRNIDMVSGRLKNADSFTVLGISV